MLLYINYTFALFDITVWSKFTQHSIQMIGLKFASLASANCVPWRIISQTRQKYCSHTTLKRAVLKLFLLNNLNEGLFIEEFIVKIYRNLFLQQCVVSFHQITPERGAFTKNARAPSIKPQLNYQGWALLWINNRGDDSGQRGVVVCHLP